MSEIEIELGVPDSGYTMQKFDPSVVVTIRGNHALAMEVLHHLEEFASDAGSIEVK